ncbi:MAG: alpha/beta hydrolase [Lacisediminihabitans sp.]
MNEKSGSDAVFDGIDSRKVATDRLEVNVLERAANGEVADGGVPVVFIHGNVSSSLFWQPTMLRLPADIRAIAIDLRGFGESEVLPVDATRGLRDYSDDIAAVLAALDITRANLVGWSMGGGIVMQYLLDHSECVASLTLLSPVSPYGFGGTRADGTMLCADGAGTGGGGANPDFVARLRSGDRSADEQTSPRSVYRSSYVKAGFVSEFEDVWVESMLTTSTAVGNYPGNSVASENWPGFAPGDTGVLNTMAPQYFNTSGIVDVQQKPSILWVRGLDDAIVSDASFFDLNMLGQVGVIPGWPGAEVAPPQPMVTQTRSVLDAYQVAGGSYREVALENCGHSPQLEQAEAFDAALHAVIVRD